MVFSGYWGVGPQIFVIITNYCLIPLNHHFLGTLVSRDPSHWLYYRYILTITMNITLVTKIVLIRIRMQAYNSTILELCLNVERNSTHVHADFRPCLKLNYSS